jgi:hypothetical protein
MGRLEAIRREGLGSIAAAQDSIAQRTARSSPMNVPFSELTINVEVT